MMDWQTEDGESFTATLVSIPPASYRYRVVLDKLEDEERQWYVRVGDHHFSKEFGWKGMSADLAKKEAEGILIAHFTSLLSGLGAEAPALKTAHELVGELMDHLDYAGWGDNWERECSEALRKRAQAYCTQHNILYAQPPVAKD